MKQKKAREINLIVEMHPKLVETLRNMLFIFDRPTLGNIGKECCDRARRILEDADNSLK